MTTFAIVLCFTTLPVSVFGQEV
ncbi:MAG: hypothetical protein JWP63_4434, partial [Candidatus Solibacter sp.]|nr:hypothetical protein [Candidatus Solibacter sp.]